MTSALKPSGSTDVGGARCWRCHEVILAGDEWHLGHLTDRVSGGGDDALLPEHAYCSQAAGGSLGLARRRRGDPGAPSAEHLRPPGGWPGPSRDWWGPDVPKGRRGYPVGDRRNES